MKYVVMLDRSAGNEVTGEAWTETKVFPETATLAEVEQWIRATSNLYRQNPDTPEIFRANVRLAVAQ